MSPIESELKRKRDKYILPLDYFESFIVIERRWRNVILQRKRVATQENCSDIIGG